VILIFKGLTARLLYKSFGVKGLNKASNAILSFFQPSPLSLSKGLLVPNRYTPNPQYSACAAPDTILVPQLSRDKLCFLQEIGEGCFGKVYKGKDQLLAPKLRI
jgi:hypothetical protein